MPICLYIKQRPKKTCVCMSSVRRDKTVYWICEYLITWRKGLYCNVNVKTKLTYVEP